MAKALGIPGYAPDHGYNYICLTFWLGHGGPWDAAKIWSNPLSFIGAGKFG